MSGAVRYLVQIGMARRESEPGSRRLYYRAPNNVWDEVIGIRDHLMARWTGVLRDGVAILGADTPAGERVAESVRFFEFVSSELPLVIRKWRERGLAATVTPPRPLTTPAALFPRLIIKLRPDLGKTCSGTSQGGGGRGA